MESQPQNPEFRSNPENFHSYILTKRSFQHNKHFGIILYSKFHCSNNVEYDALLHSGTTGLNFGLGLHHVPYFVYTSSEEPLQDCKDVQSRLSLLLLADVIKTKVLCARPIQL